MIDIEIILLFLAFAGISIAAYVFRCSIDKLKVEAIAEMQKLKELKQTEYEMAKEDLRATLAQKSDVESRLLDALAKQKEASQNVQEVTKLSAEDWLLKEGYLKIEQVAKARNVINKTHLALDVVSTCVVMGFVSESLAKEAIQLTRRATEGCQA